MWRNKYTIAAALVAACVGIVAIYLFSTRPSELASCHAVQEADQQIECIFRIIEKRLTSAGVDAAFKTFTKAYEQFPAFVQTGCHRQAHRVGDLAYYRLYVGNEDITRLDLPQSTTACGYGFYHGLLEHMTQDHPSAAYVTKTCQYLTEKLEPNMEDIRMTCYHGSGHGFTLAQSEKVPKSQWGNVAAYTALPLKECEALSDANKRDVEQCKEGVFNVLVEWMEIRQFGFEYNLTRPFAICDSVGKADVKACYYEMAQKLDGLAERDPIKMAKIVAPIKNTALRTMAFQVGIAGIIQNVIQSGGQYAVLEQCQKLPEDLYTECLRSVLHGLFEHGLPQQEYVQALEVCKALQANQSSCFDDVSQRLRRFYTVEKSLAICNEFPTEFQESCRSQVT